MKRRDFLLAGTALTASSLMPATPTWAQNRTLQMGMIGTGLRGQTFLKGMLARNDVEVVALCDCDAYMLGRAMNIVAASGKPAPRAYGGDNDLYTWQRFVEEQRHLDAVLIATPWEWHAPMAIAAMQANIAVACEVVAGITLQDHWDVLNTQIETGTPYMLLENVCYRRDVMAVLQMVRAGLFGELVHLQAGYQHDLRAAKFNTGNPDSPHGTGVEFGPQAWSEARWRTQHSIDRNGELYPSHGIGPCAMYAGINRGNQFTRINSFASKARGLHDYTVAKSGGTIHPSTRVEFNLGDIVTTTLACANGETIFLQHDTSLPRPYSLGFRVQGTKGLWMDVNRSIHIEDRSPPHHWEDFSPYQEQYEHPLWKTHAETAAGSGHGGMDWFVLHAFVEALKADQPMPIDIYDAITWSAITPLSEQSIAEGFKTLDFPDFTNGQWPTRAPIFAFDARY